MNMMKTLTRHFVLLALPVLILGALGTSVSAQDGAGADTVMSLPGIEIKTSVDKAEIYIGDLVNYTLSITYDSTYELIPPPLGANLGAFDVKDYKPDVTTKLKDGRIRSDNTFVLSTFTTGDYIIPPIPVIFKLKDGTRKALLSESVPIKVKSLLLNSSDSADIKPLKAQYEFKRNLTPYYIWGGVILFVLLVSGIWLYLRLTRKKEVAEPVDLRPAWEIAFEKLAFLKQKNLIGEKQHKAYYFELTDILRSFHGRMFAFNAMDMTSEEFFAIFEQKELPEGLLPRTRSLMNHADLVKFAKFVPDDERAESDFEEVHRMIDEVREDYERKLQPEVHISNGNGGSQTSVAVEEEPSS
jgi:hypothetical protein